MEEGLRGIRDHKKPYSMKTAFTINNRIRAKAVKGMDSSLNLSL
ncbi:MAG: hypothetical protein QXK12_00580 [Candidatus Nezhaarchaeales archaeon]